MNEVVVGFIPLLDCAALAAAKEKGFAEQEGLHLSLVRETSWANIRDRVVVGHFDAAHMLGPMTVASSLGLGHLTVPMVAPFALGLGGNAVTVSLPLHAEMEAAGPLSDKVGDAAAARVAGQALRRVVASRAASGLEPLTLGMVYPFSCHNYELRYWLAASGIDPDHDVRLVVIPPPFLVDAMRAGHVDAFCVGEPWNSVAVEAGVGRIVLSTTAIWRWSPEKVLGCRADWAERRADLLAPLCRALYRASAWCAQPGNRRELASLLAVPSYVGASAESMERALGGLLRLETGGDFVEVEEFQVPVAHAATYPWVSHARWFYSQMVRWGQAAWSPEAAERAAGAYRPDLYRAALAPLGLDMPLLDARTEGRPGGTNPVPSTMGTMAFDGDGFFDGAPFDPADLAAYARSFAIPAS
jgi:ABC-type nitrate/sulfonate/bicarbonate transport system substrate-binding protein